MEDMTFVEAYKGMSDTSRSTEDRLEMATQVLQAVARDITTLVEENLNNSTLLFGALRVILCEAEDDEDERRKLVQQIRKATSEVTAAIKQGGAFAHWEYVRGATVQEAAHAGAIAAMEQQRVIEEARKAHADGTLEEGHCCLGDCPSPLECTAAQRCLACPGHGEPIH